MLLRAMLLQVFYSVRSERQLMERLEFDLLFRWFVGLGIDDPVLVSTWPGACPLLLPIPQASHYRGDLDSVAGRAAIRSPCVEPSHSFRFL